jgi:hypothetical protein
VLPTSTLVVPPNAVVYAVVPRRRPRFGEPRHVSPAVSRVRGFGPVTLELVFLFFDYIQILANLKICVVFI